MSKLITIISRIIYLVYKTYKVNLKFLFVLQPNEAP